MQDTSQVAGPRWRRRKDARPAEITAAALTVFSDHGFAAAKLDDIARQAGVSKAAIYLYFSTKEELFRAVVRAAIVPNVQAIRQVAEGFDGPLADLAPRLLTGAAGVLDQPAISGFVRMVIGESRNFPDMAAIWRDEVVAPIYSAVTRMIARAQARGEVRSGDPDLLVFSLVGPMFMAMLFRDVFAVESATPDLALLAQQHAQILLRGLLVAPLDPS